MRTHNSLQTKITEKQRTLKDDGRTEEESVMSGCCAVEFGNPGGTYE